MIKNGIFDRLKSENQDVWQAYTHHEFINALQRGDLPKEAFQYYLKQDYVFLIHFARAYALAIFKSHSLAEMRTVSDTLHGLINVEMDMHISYCKEWGIDVDTLEHVEEAQENLAYTRYVLDRGMAGDVFDLLIALSPCVIGYGEIGARLKASPDTVVKDNPYTSWIDMYASDDYQEVVTSTRNYLDELADRHLTDQRAPQISKIFRDATRLEVGFWQMGLDYQK
jgi:thiaminase (transcriptional activator TenA)